MNRLSKGLVIFGALLLWYALVGFLIAPALIRHFGEAELQARFHPDSSISKVRINPFTASFRVEGLQVSDSSGAWSVAWEGAELDISAATWIKWYPVIDALRLTAADFRFEKRGGGDAIDASGRGSGEGWRYWVDSLNLAEVPDVRIDLLEVAASRFEFTDRTAAELYKKTIDSINFTLRDLSTAVEGDSEMRLIAETEEGASLSWKGDFRSQPIRSSGRLTLSGLAVHDLSPYYTPLIRFQLKRAVFGIRFDYELNLSNRQDLFRVRDGQLQLTEVLCVPIDSNEQLISIETVRAEGVDFRFPKMSLDVTSLSIETGETRIFRDADGQINLAQLLALPDSPQPAPESAAESPPGADELPELSYRIGKITLSDYRILWEQSLRTATARLTVGIPQMEITGFSSDLASPFNLVADYRIGESGTARVEGSVVPGQPALYLNMEMQSLPLFLLSPYAQSFRKTVITEGVFDFTGRFQYAAEGDQTLSGDAAIRQIDFVYDGNLQATWSSLDLTGLRLDLAPFALAIETVALQQPQLAYTQTAGAARSKGPADKQSAEGEGQSIRMPVRVGKLTLSDGSMTFIDESFDPAPEITMDALSLELSGLDLGGGQTANLALSTQINGSTLELEGEFNGSQFKETAHWQASLQGLAMPAFSAYSGQAVGRRIASGLFNLQSDWTIESGRLDASNQIHIDQFELGDSVDSESAVNLPLDLAVTLLKGPGGVLDLSLPLSGDLSDPQLGIGQIVRTAIVGLITNVATAPFKILAGLVGAEEDLSVVRFAAGSSELSPAMVARLDALAKALKERPGLKLAVTPQISPADERRLSEDKLRIDLLGDADPADKKLYRKRLTQRYREVMKAAGTPDHVTQADDEAGLEKMLAALLPGIELEDPDRAALAAARVAAIREHLVSVQGIEPERLTVKAPQTGTAEPAAMFELE